MSIRWGVLMVSLAAACAGEIPGDEVGTTTAASITPVTWTKAMGVTAVGNDLVKSAADTSWNAGASSVERVARDGYVEFTTGENTTAKMAGLSYVDTYAYEWDIRFAVYLKANGIVAIREHGELRDADVGSYAAGDVFRVQVLGGVVTYWQNGSLLYTSSEDLRASLVLDTSLKTPGATISDAIVETRSFWTAIAGASADGNDLARTSGVAAWNAGARSIRSLNVDGYAEFTTGETTTAKMAGLSNGDSDASYQDIDFAIYLKADGTMAVREGGVLRGTFGSYAAGDLFRVTADDGVVTYARNGTVFYTSSGTPTFPLLLDTSLRTAGATIEDASLVEIPGPAIVFDNPGGAFVWTPTTYGYSEFVQGAFLDLTLPAAEQTGAPSLSAIEFFKRWSEENITPGGFYFRSWRNPDGPPRGASLAAGEDIVLPWPQVFDRLYRPPLVVSPGDAVGSADRWISGEPGHPYYGAGVQAAHFQDPGGDTPPTQVFFTSGTVGVRFRGPGGYRYGFVELAYDPVNGGQSARYVPVRWGYNPVANQPVLIPP